jgi:hypothetical protein
LLQVSSDFGSGFGSSQVLQVGGSGFGSSQVLQVGGSGFGSGGSDSPQLLQVGSSSDIVGAAVSTVSAK